MLVRLIQSTALPQDHHLGIEKLRKGILSQTTSPNLFLDESAWFKVLQSSSMSPDQTEMLIFCINYAEGGKMFDTCSLMGIPVHSHSGSCPHIDRTCEQEWSNQTLTGFGGSASAGILAAFIGSITLALMSDSELIVQARS